MKSLRCRHCLWLLALVCAAVMACRYGTTPEPQAQGPKKPRLAVLVVFDQMRGDYLTRWQDLYDKEGFGRLQTEGAWFQNCHYPYAYTYTSAGHSSLATGCSPDKHGIVANYWYDRKLGDRVESVEAEKYPLVPKTAAKYDKGAAPVNRKQPSIGDALMDQTKDKAKVVSISLKDRAAILLAALRALLCLWLDPTNGMIVTSTFFNGGHMPGWVTKLNKAHHADQWFAKDWTRLRPDLNYDKLAGPDDVEFEGNGTKQGKTFPHPTDGGKAKAGKEYYRALESSPFGNELVLDLAKRAIVEEKLGQGDVPDLLCLSFSSNDYVGHYWGPDSQEVLDVTLRADLIMKELLQFLDEKVGKGEYLLVVSADHGVCPIPEVAKAKGKDAARIPPQELLVTGAEDFLNKEFGNGQTLEWVASIESGMIYLNPGAVSKAGVKQEAAEKALAQWLAKQAGILKAYTRTELLAGAAKDDSIGQMVQRSFDPERSGDVLPVLKPYHLLLDPPSKKEGNYATSHGTPHEYDTHVPLLVFGTNVQPGIHKDKVTPQAAAGILAAGLGVEPPKGAEAAVPKGLWK